MSCQLLLIMFRLCILASFLLQYYYRINALLLSYKRRNYLGIVLVNNKGMNKLNNLQSGFPRHITIEML